MRPLRQVALVVCTLLVACTSRGPDSLLAGSPNCSLPCWSAIRPGVSTEDQALAIVRQMDGVESLTVDERFVSFGYPEHGSNRIHSNAEHVVDWIDLELHSTTLSEVIGAFGEPDRVLLGMDPGGCAYHAFLTEQGLILHGPCQPAFMRAGWVLSPGSTVSGIYLAVPNQSIDEMLALVAGTERARVLKADTAPWAGYGTYNPTQ
jgi:hypothetical protein